MGIGVLECDQVLGEVCGEGCAIARIGEAGPRLKKGLGVQVV